MYICASRALCRACSTDDNMPNMYADTCRCCSEDIAQMTTCRRYNTNDNMPKMIDLLEDSWRHADKGSRWFIPGCNSRSPSRYDLPLRPTATTYRPAATTYRYDLPMLRPTAPTYRYDLPPGRYDLPLRSTYKGHASGEYVSLGAASTFLFHNARKPQCELQCFICLQCFLPQRLLPTMLCICVQIHKLDNPMQAPSYE